jgi:phosphate starvation-inducible PhoH-like protein
VISFIVEKHISFEDNRVLKNLLGNLDENVILIAENTHTEISLVESGLCIKGEDEDVKKTVAIIEDLTKIAEKGYPVGTKDINLLLESPEEESFSLSSLREDVVLVTPRGKRVFPKTPGQKRYVDVMRKYDLVFAIGPAGTGKTYLAMAMALIALRNKSVARIILTRPAIEAGERLGFLPGDLQEKVDPYLRPLYDALYDMLESDKIQKYMERGVIEVAPLAYMRGRTLNDAFVILDEAQNTTPEQMKMFLTRMGFGSRYVVTGDITQIDLPTDRESGLILAQRILKDVNGLAFVYLTEQDVVRHDLVQRIVKAYNVYESNIKSTRR